MQSIMSQPSSKQKNEASEYSNQLCHKTFLSLPREVRDLTYTFALTSLEPIIVWSGEIKTTIIEPESVEYSDGIDIFTRPSSEIIVDRINRDMDFSAMAFSKRNLALGLLQCHPVLASETAAIFYRVNTFTFLGYHSWRPINLWLESIGSQNQKYLTNLEISMPQPMHVKQESDGMRVETAVSWSLTRFEDVAQRHNRLVLSTEQPLEGIVENINPAVEDLFEILGSNGPKLKISFLLTSGVCPGSEPSKHEEDQTPGGYWFGMDLPNLTELFRWVYTTNRGGTPRVDIVVSLSHGLPTIHITMTHQFTILRASFLLI